MCRRCLRPETFAVKLVCLREKDVCKPRCVSVCECVIERKESEKEKVRERERETEKEREI